MMRRVRPALVTCVTLLAACGARTGLLLPDADGELDAGRRDASAIDARPIDAPPDTFVPPDVCVPRAIEVTPIRAEVMFVLDRSTSMGWALTGPDGAGPSRWSILVDTLHSELPRYDATTDMGLLLFPSDDGGSFCNTAAEPQLAPREDASSSMLSIVDSTGPGGRTPTADGMASARDYFMGHPDRSRVRAAVLATDGAPNCNPDLDGSSCPCTGGAGLPVGGSCRMDPSLCLDDTRSADVLAELFAAGVPTYVIGIDGDPDPALSAVLTRLARAGGRPNPLDPVRGYYSVRRPADLGAAFDRIQSSIERCSLSVASPPPPGAEPILTIDGEDVPHDPTRTEGWEWIDEADLTMALHGEACRRVQLGSHTLELVTRCPR